MQGSQADGAPRAEAGGNSYVDQWVLGCVREESFERSLDETDASWVAGLPDSRNTSELEDVLSPLSLKGASDGDGIYDEIEITDRRQRPDKNAQSVPASVPRLSLNDFGKHLSKLPEVRAEDDEDETFEEIEEGSDGLNSRDDSVTECDSRPITARSRCSSRGDSTVSREGSRDSRRTHPEDSQSDGQPLSARSFDLRERQALSARGGVGGGGSEAGGSDAFEGAPLGARTASGDLCPRGLPPFSPRFLSPRIGAMGPPSGLGASRPSPRIHGVTSAGPRSILSPRCGPGSLMHSQSELVQGSGPWGIVGDSPRQRQVPCALCETMTGGVLRCRHCAPVARQMLMARLSLPLQSEAMVATLSLAQHKDLDNAARRVAQLEELLQKAQEENAQLQSQLQAHLACAAGPDDASEAKGAAEGSVRGVGELGEEEDNRAGKEAQGSKVEAAEVPAGIGDEVAGAHCTEPDAEHGGNAASASAVKGFRGTMEEGQEFARKWEITADEVCRVRCIGRGAAGAVYEGRWRGGAVAIKVYATSVLLLIPCDASARGLCEHAVSASSVPVLCSILYLGWLSCLQARKDLSGV